MALIDDIIETIETTTGHTVLDNSERMENHNAFSEQIRVVPDTAISYLELSKTVEEMLEIIGEEERRSAMYVIYVTEEGVRETATVASTELFDATLSQAQGNLLDFSTRYQTAMVLEYGFNLE